MTQKYISTLFFFILLLLIFSQLISIFRIFLTPILWAIILTLIFYPLYERIRRTLKERRSLASIAVVLIVFVVTAGPMVFFSGTLVKEAVQFYGNLADWLSGDHFEALWGRFAHSSVRIIWDKIVEKTAALNIQIVPVVVSFFQRLPQVIVNQIQSGTKNFIFFILYYFASLMIFFFFLRDGEGLVRGVKDLFPMSMENKQVVFARLAITVSAVIRGLVVTGVVQGTLGGLAFWLLGVPFPIFLALLIAFFALVPIGGAALVWFPASAYLFLTDHWGKALILFIWGALVISTIDNILKPLLIGEKIKIPALFLFFAILGGIVTYGMIGVFLGPIFLVLFLTLIEIYRKEYKGAEERD